MIPELFIDHLDLLFCGLYADGDRSLLGLLLIERHGLALDLGHCVKLSADHLQVDWVDLCSGLGKVALLGHALEVGQVVLAHLLLLGVGSCDGDALDDLADSLALVVLVLLDVLLVRVVAQLVVGWSVVPA